ncbi:hypothetical protein [Microbacterium sp.]|uniref:hypothetical protein n=1 Tax=Microbacterium sp. TaxID=51671 RepID=UPI00261EA5E5|nr:hypothetical protein [Microbacterium sp.]
MSASRLASAFRESLYAYIPVPSSPEGIGSGASDAAKQWRYNRAVDGIASTGTPVKTIHGAARYNAAYAILGGGTKANGGGGVAGGLASQVHIGKLTGVAAELAYPLFAAGCHLALDTTRRYAIATWRDRKSAADSRALDEAS